MSEYKNFSVGIPTYNSSKYVKDLLKKLTKLRYLNDVVIIDDNSEVKEQKEIKKIVKEFQKSKELNIKSYFNEENLGGFKNKYKVVSLCSEEIVYQIDSDNILSNKTISFLNNENNFKYIKKNHIYLPYFVRLFETNQSFLEFRKKKINLVKRELSLSLEDVKDAINEKSNIIHGFSIGYLLNIGNSIFYRDEYLSFLQEGSILDRDFTSADAIAVIYYWLKNGGHIELNKNIGHSHRLRDDSYWHEGHNAGENHAHLMKEILNLN